MRTLEGKVVAKEIKVGIVAARFNEFIVSKLVAGARDGLLRHDVKDEDIDLAWVPGAFEIPLIASKMAKSGKYDAVICLGAVIRGATSHYDYVCSEVSKGIANVSLSSDIPVSGLHRIRPLLQERPLQSSEGFLPCSGGKLPEISLLSVLLFLLSFPVLK